MHVDLKLLQTAIDQLEEQLGSDELFKDTKQLKKVSKEHSYARSVYEKADALAKAEKQLIEVSELLKSERDPEFLEVLAEEQRSFEQLIPRLKQEIERLLIPPADDDDQNTVVEIRAGAGGQEAMLFAADCMRMYEMYAARMGWQTEMLSCTPSDLGGVKEVVVAFTGKNVWRLLQYEGGTHRVQRVPATEAQGRIHTSTITVAILPEAEEETDIQINEQDLRMEATRSSGAGGQHVNKTDSAVRITHMPSGIVIFCQEERSQHKNKDKALRLLKVKLKEIERQKIKDEQDSKRAQQVGTADRSEKIRTYNFPQSRVTDHRINFTKYNISSVMDGDLEDFSLALITSYKKNAQKSLPSWVITD